MAMDAEELRDEANKLEDDELKKLVDLLLAETDRRRTIQKGLDAGEMLQFETLVNMVKDRTKLDRDDVSAMIRAHTFNAAPTKSPRKKT